MNLLLAGWLQCRLCCQMRHHTSVSLEHGARAAAMGTASIFELTHQLYLVNKDAYCQPQLNLLIAVAIVENSWHSTARQSLPASGMLMCILRTVLCAHR